ncbi:MAG: hypothetical protein KKG75_04775 [Nanoarchaeota archaeon]|nr:hypothetical protein [Nanoarchaeota archaeon]
MILENKETGKIKYIYDEKETSELISSGFWKKLSGIEVNRLAMNFKN